MITSVDAYFRNEDTINGRPADITDFPTLSKRWKNISDLFQKLTKEYILAQSRDLDQFYEYILENGMQMGIHCNMYCYIMEMRI